MNNISFKSYSYHEIGASSLIIIKGLGHQNITSKNYYWNNSKRKDFHCIFQYTLSGKGAIKIGNKLHYQYPGDAFFIDVPSKTEYFLPENSTNWEILYLEFSKEVLPIMHRIYAQFGPILHLSDNKEILKTLLNIFKFAENGTISQIYKNSNIAYSFLMELCSYSAQNQYTISEQITKAQKYIENNYSDASISLDDLAEVSNLSKFYFTHEFKKQVGIPPGKYLIEVRLKNAAEMLVTKKDLNIEEIAFLSGFSNGNYFGKSFKKLFGITPNEFRKTKRNYNFTTIFYDPLASKISNSE